MVEIYCPYLSERLKYVLNYVFNERLGIEYTLVSTIETVANTNKLLINYSDQSIHGSLQIIPQGILSETGIRYLVFDLLEQEDASILIKKPENHLYFDLFAAIFYLISRYEEYLMFGKDKHQRFRYQDSCLFKGNCLHLPLVDSWILNFRKLLISEFGFAEDSFKKDEFNVKTTLDIDSVFTYKGRPIYRNLAALLKDIVLLRFSEIVKRFKVVLLGYPDPNDNFEYQLNLLDEKGIKAIYFFQVGPYGTYDKNINPMQPDFINIIKKVWAAGHTIGLHPSYQSNGESEKILDEKKILESIIGEPIVHSRQHYLKFVLPKTYRELLASNIREEHSMGYSEINGFRAGTAFPFYWFDLEQNQSTDLLIVPFSIMDVAYKQFLGLNVEEAIEQSEIILDVLKVHQAPFCFVFHNESLSGHRGWQGWRKVFKFWING